MTPWPRFGGQHQPADHYSCCSEISANSLHKILSNCLLWQTGRMLPSTMSRLRRLFAGRSPLPLAPPVGAIGNDSQTLLDRSSDAGPSQRLFVYGTALGIGLHMD